jgi:SAM-dependent methyltransferase
VFDAIVRYGVLPAGPSVVEIGAGTGQATVQMAARGWRVLAVEPGAQLAALAHRRLAAFDQVTVATSTFEAAELSDSSFDVVAAATAWHWVDPVSGYAKAARVLTPEGVIALWWNAHVPDTSDPGWTPIRRVYEEVAPELARLARLTPDRPDYDPALELEHSGHFRDVQEIVFPFSVTYTSTRFLTLIDTYASHQRLDPAARDRLHRRLQEVIATELSGVVTKPYDAVLVLGRRATRP